MHRANGATLVWPMASATKRGASDVCSLSCPTTTSSSSSPPRRRTMASAGRWIAFGAFACGTGAGASDPPFLQRLETGSLSNYPNIDEGYALIDEFAKANPHYLRKFKLGTSYESRPMHVYELTLHADNFNEGKVTDANSGPTSANDPDVKAVANTLDEKPHALITSLLHAREPGGLVVVLHFIGTLLHHALVDNEPRARYILESRRLLAVPFANPDGYVANMNIQRTTGKPGVIRKNRRSTCPADERKGGVDLNRNWGNHFVRSTNGCSEEYSGTEPFSEPETQAFKKLTELRRLGTALNYHSYGQMLTHPYNWVGQNDNVENGGMPFNERAVFDEIGQAYDTYSSIGTAYETLQYTTTGESDDWMFGEAGIYSCSPEVGPEFNCGWNDACTIKNFYTPKQYIPQIYANNFNPDGKNRGEGGIELGMLAVKAAASGKSATGIIASTGVRSAEKVRVAILLKRGSNAAALGADAKVLVRGSLANNGGVAVPALANCSGESPGSLCLVLENAVFMRRTAVDFCVVLPAGNLTTVGTICIAEQHSKTACQCIHPEVEPPENPRARTVQTNPCASQHRTAARKKSSFEPDWNKVRRLTKDGTVELVQPRHLTPSSRSHFHDATHDVCKLILEGALVALVPTSSRSALATAAVCGHRHALQTQSGSSSTQRKSTKSSLPTMNPHETRPSTTSAPCTPRRVAGCNQLGTQRMQRCLDLT